MEGVQVDDTDDSLVSNDRGTLMTAIVSGRPPMFPGYCQLIIGNLVGSGLGRHCCL